MMVRWLALGIAAVLPVCPSASVRAEETENEVHFLDCGTRSLFLLFQLCDIPANLAEIEVALPIPAEGQGYSMTDLQEVARSSGLTLEGIQLGEENLPLDLPVIAHAATPEGGHFYVLRPVGTTGTMVHVYDPPFLSRIVDYGRLMAEPSWTGKLLVPRYPSESPHLYYGVAVALFVLLLTVRLRFPRRSTIWIRHRIRGRGKKNPSTSG